MTDSTSRSSRARETIWLVTAAIVLTVLMAWPVLFDPAGKKFGTELVGYHPDAYLVISWFDAAARLNPTTQPATDWVGVALARLVDPVTAFNLLILATFPLAAWFTFLLARRLGLETWPGAFAALLFAFSPFHIAHAAYHPHISQIQWVPLYFLALWLCLERWTLGRALGLVASAAILTLSNFYAGLIGAVVTLVAVPALWLARDSTGLRESRSHLIRTALTLGACALLGALYLLRVARVTIGAEARYTFPYQDLFRYCARWWSYLVPSVEHPFLGDWAREIWRRHEIAGGLVEQQVFLGWSLIVLAGIAVYAYFRGERHPQPFVLVPALAAVAVAALYCSLPPEGRFDAIPRPTAVLHHWLPMFRAHARFGLVVQLMVCLLAATGLTWLARRGQRGYRLAAWSLVAVAVLELSPVPPFRWHWVLPTEAHRWVERQPEHMKILDCAKARPGQSVRLQRMRHEVRPVGGDLDDCAEPGMAAKLAALGYTHVLVQADYPLAGAIPTEGLDLVSEFADSHIYSIAEPKASLYVGRSRGFSWREIEGDRSHRWMGAEGSWILVNRTRQPLTVTLHIELRAFPATRGLVLILRGQELASLQVPPAWGEFAIGPVEIPPGSHRLDLRPTGRPVRPDDVLGNGDSRELTIGVADWSFEGGAAASASDG